MVTIFMKLQGQKCKQFEQGILFMWQNILKIVGILV